MRIHLSRHAMATRFDLTLHGDDPVALEQAGEAAFDAIERLDDLLSFFRPTSDLAAVNRWAAQQPIRLEPRVVELLLRCKEVWAATDGAFDPTIGPVTRAARCAALGLPQDDWTEAKAAVGFDGVEIDAQAGTVRFARPGMALDLGGAARGYAVDCAIDVLREHGVTSAFLRGGASSVHVIGTPPGEAGWKVTWETPAGSAARARVLSLADTAVSISGRQGRSLAGELVPESHVRDPRTGDVVTHTLAAGVVGASSLTCDMLSTALLVAGSAWLPTMQARFPGYTGWVAEPAFATA
jgi:thiamine biosynthesis lipoprotein